MTQSLDERQTVRQELQELLQSRLFFHVMSENLPSEEGGNSLSLDNQDLPHFFRFLVDNEGKSDCTRNLLPSASPSHPQTGSADYGSWVICPLLPSGRLTKFSLTRSHRSENRH